MPPFDEKKFTALNTSKITKLRSLKIDYTRIKNFRDMEKETNIKFLTRVEWLKNIPIEFHAVLEIVGQARPAFPADRNYQQNFSSTHYPNGRVVVAVNSAIYAAITPAINQYVIDMAADGYYAMVYTVNGSSAVNFKNFLKTVSGGTIKGCVMVGSIAVPWFEMNNDFDDTTTEFPCDFYYMDWNGTWGDADGDSKFDSHTGSVQPEIWVSRIWTPTAGGNDTALINDYFNRNHLFRAGKLGSAKSALALTDDDWESFGDCAFDSMFPASAIETISAPNATTADRYRSEIVERRGWAQIGAHSSPGGHSFKEASGTSSSWVPASWLRDTHTPKANFYNLYACSNARYTQPDYMGGWYIFDKAGGETGSGIAAVGSTKTGSMLIFENFYAPMGAGKVLGEAYKDWWTALGPDHDLEERRWYYGMTILGDPTVNWWSGLVPVPTSPASGSAFNHFPRTMTLQWAPVNVPGVTYTIEVDALGAVTAGQWAAANGGSFFIRSGITGTSFNHSFVGAQRGRWRVKAVQGSTKYPWSEWQYFRFTV